MTTTTSETITVGGLVLNTLGYNVRAIPHAQQTREARHQRIPRRDEPLRQRQQVRPAELDIDLWVSDRDVDGVPGGVAQMWANLDAIMTACASPRDLVTIERVRGGLTVSAAAELVGPVRPEQVAERAMFVTLPFLMPYPYWEGEEVSPLLTGGDGTVTNSGQVECTKVLVRLEAGGSGWSNPTVENITSGTSITYTGSIPADDTIFVDIHAGTVVDEAGDSHAGAVSLTAGAMAIAPGDNTIATTDASGGGNVRFVFRPPYMF